MKLLIKRYYSLQIERKMSEKRSQKSKSWKRSQDTTPRKKNVWFLKPDITIKKKTSKKPLLFSNGKENCLKPGHKNQKLEKTLLFETPLRKKIVQFSRWRHSGYPFKRFFRHLTLSQNVGPTRTHETKWKSTLARFLSPYFLWQVIKQENQSHMIWHIRYPLSLVHFDWL